METTTAPERVEETDVEEVAEPDRPWLVICWNDPINLMPYVTWVFQKLFGYSHEKATKLMLDVHYKGRGRRRSSTASGCTRTGCGPPSPRPTDGRNLDG